jgi:Gas vesicle synthesis protein GvpL/GvpF/Gas vesicle protein
VWMYAVTTDSEEPLTGRLTGVGGGQLRTAGAAGLTAIVGDVSEAEFGEFTLRSNLEDLDWVERTARAHHAAIKTVAERCPVVPMRLATVYASDRGVVQTLQQRAGDLRAALARITGPEPMASLRRDQRIALVDLLDRVLAGGVVIAGDVTLSIADVDLVTVSLRALVTSVSALLEAQEPLLNVLDAQEQSR